MPKTAGARSRRSVDFPQYGSDERALYRRWPRDSTVPSCFPVMPHTMSLLAIDREVAGIAKLVKAVASQKGLSQRTFS